MQSTTATSQRPTTSITTASSGPGEWIHNRHVGPQLRRRDRKDQTALSGQAVFSVAVASGRRRRAQTGPDQAEVGCWLWHRSGVDGTLSVLLYDAGSASRVEDGGVAIFAEDFDATTVSTRDYFQFAFGSGTNASGSRRNDLHACVQDDRKLQ